MTRAARIATPALLVALLGAPGCSPAMRVALRPIYEPAEPGPEPVEVRLDVPYRNGDGADAAKHRLDLYLPERDGWPLLAFVHGGSLEKGDSAQRVAGHDIYRNVGRFFSTRGVGVALINYRLQPDVRWPEQVDDVAAATAWLIERARSLGGDGRLYLSGHSAGAWLAAHVALDGGLHRRHGIRPGDIACMISVSGSGFDLTDRRTWESFGREEKWRRRFATGTDDERWKQRASVVPLIEPGAPPFLLLYSQREWEALARQNRLLCDALEAAGNACRLEAVSGLGHRRMLLALSDARRPVATRVIEELDEAGASAACEF